MTNHVKDMISGSRSVIYELLKTDVNDPTLGESVAETKL